METITYCPNIFIPLTTACINNCSYCQFRSPLAEAKFLSLTELKSRLLQAKKAGCKEVLFSSGSQPYRVAGFHSRLKAATGFESWFKLLTTVCKQALDLGLLPHSNCGVIKRSELKELARYNASLGLMLETTANLEVHRNSPTKKPEKRLKMIEQAGQLEIPFTTGLLLGIGETDQDRKESLRRLSRLQADYGHLQEVILQPVKTPAETESTGLKNKTLVNTVKLARRILPPEVALQVPPNLVDLKTVIGLIDDLGGISSLSIDHINPEYSWPTVKQLNERFPRFKFKARLPVYPRYINDQWLSRPVLNCLAEEGWLDVDSN